LTFLQTGHLWIEGSQSKSGLVNCIPTLAGGEEMKIKKVLAMAIASFMLLSIFAVMAAPSVKAADPVANEYLGIAIGDDSRFTLGTTGGDPDNANDDNAILLYGHPFPWSSFTTLKIDGSDVAYGGSSGIYTQVPTSFPTYISGVWESQKIEATQTLSLTTNPATGREDAMMIQYKLTNTDPTNTHTVGLRILLDTMLGENDGAPFQISGSDAVTTEREYVGAAVPDYWQAFDSLDDPKVIAQGTLRGGGATPPDRAIFVYWMDIYITMWDYTVDPAKAVTGDSAVGLYWNSVTLSPGQSVEYMTYYGISGLSSSTLPPLALSVTGPAVLSVVNGAYSPNPFTITAYVQDLSVTDDIQGVTLAIDLPTGLTLVGSPVTQLVGNLIPNEIRSVSWSVQAESQTSEQLFYYTVTATATDPVVEREVTRGVLVPALTINLPPVANAGQDQEVSVGTEVTLDGRGSYDPENSQLTYAWSIQSAPGGSNAQLSDSSVAQPTFTSDIVGDYVFALIVKDILGLKSTTSDTVTITALDTTPPTVVSVNPVNEAMGVEISTAVQVTFSEAMNPATVAFGLANGGSVSGNLVWTAGNTVCTLTPAVTLQYSTVYSVLVTGQDVAGNEMTSPYSSTFTTSAIPATIDIKPGCFPNTISPKYLLIPVAIIGTSTFDVKNVDRMSLTFGPTGTEAKVVMTYFSDVNGDGRLDLCCYFWMMNTHFKIGDTKGVLDGRMLDGKAFTGTDSIKIVPK
jgi:hypothetical protein